MSMTDHSPKIEVITSVPLRRQWSAAEKMRMVEETYQPDTSVSRGGRVTVSVKAGQAQVAARTPEHVQISGMGIAAESLLNLERQAVHATSHIGSPHGQPHANARRKCNHRRSNASRTNRRSRGLTLRPSRTR